MFSGGSRNQNSQDGLFLLKEQAGGWQSPTVSGGGGFTAGGWNTPAPANSDAKSTDLMLEPTTTKPLAVKPAATTPKTTTGNTYSQVGAALAGATAYQDRDKKTPNPWAMENSTFDMSGIGDLMSMATRAKGLGGL
jgi:hypothetical protein